MPSLLLTVDRGTFVAWLTADTATPGITPPVGSLTRPLRLACPVCAERMQAETARRDPIASALDHIVCLPGVRMKSSIVYTPMGVLDTKKRRLGPIVAFGLPRACFCQRTSGKVKPCYCVHRGRN